MVSFLPILCAQTKGEEAAGDALVSQEGDDFLWRAIAEKGLKITMANSSLVIQPDFEPILDFAIRAQFYHFLETFPPKNAFGLLVIE